VQRYQITDRGWIVIVVIIVILIFIIPSTIFAVRAWTGSPPPDNTQQSAEPLPNPPDDPSNGISNGPLPNGSGLDPNGQPPPSPPNGNGESGAPTPPVEPPVEPPIEPPEYGLIDLNLSEGIMHFAYSLDNRDSLDAATTSMLGLFLTSPKNTNNARILVEIPHLSNDETTALVEAVTNAFATHGIAQQDIVYAKNQADVSDNIVEVKLLFYVAPTVK
jgi:hypothetical protein